jgi:3-hydroxy-3-methylglutaryl CoA synthase
MRGIISYGAYVPFRRLDRTEISRFFGTGGGKGTRAVASYDEDTTSMGVEASRYALRSADGASPAAVWFATTAPSYLDKTNANTIHAALRLDRAVPAIDMHGSVRSAVGALRTALTCGAGDTLVVASDVRTGLPTSSDESEGGDGAAAFLVGEGDQDRVVAEFLGVGTATEEFTDRWRVPGESRSRLWEERFGEQMYLPLADEAWREALKRADVSADQVNRLVVTGTHSRAVRVAAGRLTTGSGTIADDLAGTVGITGAAHPGLVLASALDVAAPGEVIALVVLADGAEVLLFRVTDAIESHRSKPAVADQVAGGGKVAYGKFLSWKSEVQVEPPRRPEPARPSSSAAHRRGEWKYGFVGSRDNTTGVVHMPPQRVGIKGGVTDDMSPAPMADVQGTVLTLTVDRLAYSPSPPIVFAVVDFDGGGRMPVELTDCDPDNVKIGVRVEMTFRRLFTADGIHNYFWKARPVRGAEQG